MKKYIFLLLLLSFCLVSCGKTEVDVDLENARRAEELLTNEDIETLADEDPEFAEDFIDEYNEAVDEQILNENMDLINELEDLEEQKKSGEAAKFSCEAIDKDSVCIEYYGSFWTEDMVKMGCEGTFSTNPCPSDTVGGCNVGEGTMSDMVTWFYFRGGGEITEASLRNAMNACNDTLMSSWIGAKY